MKNTYSLLFLMEFRRNAFGTRKEAKELLPKFNARDESSSLLPVDGAIRAIKSPVIHRFPIRSILPNIAPTRFITLARTTQGVLTICTSQEFIPFGTLWLILFSRNLYFGKL